MGNELEERLNSILSDPDMMGKIQAMAQSLGQSSASKPEQKQPEQNYPEHKQPEQKQPAIDFAMVQKLSSLAGQTGIDRNQRALLSALSPYLSRDRVGKLENAMRAAKLAKLASSFLGSGGLQALMGR